MFEAYLKSVGDNHVGNIDTTIVLLRYMNIPFLVYNNCFRKIQKVSLGKILFDLTAKTLLAFRSSILQASQPNPI